MTIREYISKSAISGGITDGCQAVQMLNAARELLFPLDDWTGTVEYGCVAPNECCFYLPAHIETVRKAWVCNKDVPINNENWYYLDANDLHQYCSSEIAIVRTDRSVVLPVNFPAHTQIGFAPQDLEDKGVQISVTAINQFGSTVTEVVTLSDLADCQFAELAVKEILAINKPATVGAVKVLSRSECRVRPIYTLEAFETAVRYWQYRAANVCSRITIKGKKKFFPYRENELDRQIDISNFVALQFASQAIEHLRGKRYEDHTNAVRLARSYLERSKEDLNKTNAPGKPARWEPRYPVTSNSYGYR